MNTLVTSTEDLMEVALGIIIFLVLFPFIWKSLKSFFGSERRGPILLAVCVTLLCVLGLDWVSGLFGFLAVPGKHFSESNPNRISFDFILLLYAALGLAMLVVLLFLRIRNVFDIRRRHLSDNRQSQIPRHSESSKGQPRMPLSEKPPCDDEEINAQRKDIPEKLKTGNFLSKEYRDREFK